MFYSAPKARHSVMHEFISGLAMAPLQLSAINLALARSMSLDAMWMVDVPQIRAPYSTQGMGQSHLPLECKRQIVQAKSRQIGVVYFRRPLFDKAQGRVGCLGSRLFSLL